MPITIEGDLAVLLPVVASRRGKRRAHHTHPTYDLEGCIAWVKFEMVTDDALDEEKLRKTPSRCINDPV